MSRPSVESTLFRARRRLSEEYEELVSGERCRAHPGDHRRRRRRPRGHARRAQDGAPRLLLPAVPARRVRRGLRRRRARPEAHACARRSPRCCRCRRSSSAASPATAASEDAATSAGGHAATLAQLSTAAASYADPAMQLGQGRRRRRPPLPLAGVGAGVAAHDTGLIGATPARRARRAAVVQPGDPARDAAASLTTRPAGQRHEPRPGGTRPTPVVGAVGLRRLRLGLRVAAAARARARARSPRRRRPAATP